MARKLVINSDIKEPFTMNLNLCGCCALDQHFFLHSFTFSHCAPLFPVILFAVVYLMSCIFEAEWTRDVGKKWIFHLVLKFDVFFSLNNHLYMMVTVTNINYDFYIASDASRLFAGKKRFSSTSRSLFIELVFRTNWLFL